MAKYTLSYARKMLELWLDCEMQLASGTAKHYRIGSREYTALDLTEVRLMQKKWEDEVAVLEGRANGRSVRLVVPRDL